MKIEIDSKRNNPLMNRTEIYFTVKHEGEGTPNREIIRSELAEKLNVKKENIIVSSIQSSFGAQEVSCYAKVYSSLAKSKDLEHDYILQRNKLIETKEKKVEEKPAKPPKEEIHEPPKEEEKPAEPAGEVKEETPVEEPAAKPDVTEEPPKEEEKPAENPPKEEEKPVEETPAEEPPKEETPEPEPPKEETKEEPAEQPKEETTEEKPPEEKKPAEKLIEESSEESEQSAEEKKE